MLNGSKYSRNKTEAGNHGKWQETNKSPWTKATYMYVYVNNFRILAKIEYKKNRKIVTIQTSRRGELKDWHLYCFSRRYLKSWIWNLHTELSWECRLCSSTTKGPVILLVSFSAFFPTLSSICSHPLGLAQPCKASKAKLRPKSLKTLTVAYSTKL